MRTASLVATVAPIVAPTASTAPQPPMSLVAAWNSSTLARAAASVTFGGSGIDICFRLRMASSGSADSTCRLSISARIGDAARHRHRIADGAGDAAGLQAGHHRHQRIGQLFGAHPAKITAKAGGRGFGKLPGIGDERGAAADLADDARGIVHHLRFGFGRRRQEDLGDVEFFLALGFVQLGDDRFDFVITDGDQRFDTAAQQAGPGHFTADLRLDRGFRRARRLQKVGKLLRRALEIGGNAVERALHFGIADADVVVGGFLDLQLFIDQVAHHLQAQAVALLLADLPAIGGDDKVQPLIDIGIGDDLAIDDGLRLAQLRIDGAHQPGFRQLGGGEGRSGVGRRVLGPERPGDDGREQRGDTQPGHERTVERIPVSDPRRQRAGW